MEKNEKRMVQVIYKCYVGNQEERNVPTYLEKERTRVQDSMNVDDKISYNVTVIPMQSQFSSIETLPIIF